MHTVKSVTFLVEANWLFIESNCPLDVNTIPLLNNASYCQVHAVNILSVCDIEGCGTMADLACQEQEVHVVRSYEVTSVSKVTYEGQAWPIRQ